MLRPAEEVANGGAPASLADPGRLRYGWRVRCVVGLGLCVVDHVYRVERLELSRVRTRYDEHVVAIGGMTGNALVQAARLGCRTRLLSWLGDDADGRFLRRSLRREGVDVAGLRLSPGAVTTRAVCLVARRGGERRFLVPDRRALERRAPAFDLGSVRAGSLLLIDGHFPAQALRAVRRAQRVGATVIADFHRFGAVARRLLPWVDHAIVSEEFARSHPLREPRRVLRWLAQHSGGTPVITLGARGGLYWRDGRARRFAAPRTRVRDTTGAGDAFHGAFAAALYHGLELEPALRLAARAAAVCCTALGGNARLLRRQEVAALRASSWSGDRSRGRGRRRPS